jgi:hypothetical protein
VAGDQCGESQGGGVGAIPGSVVSDDLGIGDQPDASGVRPAAPDLIQDLIRG